jgi:hypothetical protein
MAPFGPVMQLGYVVPDIGAAAAHWARLGVGPFFLLENVRYAECRFRDRPVEFGMSVAVGQWGAVQVELIQQTDAVPTIYTEFAARHGSGLQHVGVMTDDVPAHLARLEALGMRPVQAGSTANGIRFAYVDTDALPGGHPGGMVELIEHGPAIDGFFELVRSASVGWDGAKPLRRLG